MTKAALTDDQRRTLEEVMRWESEALAQLGVLELQRREAQAALEVASHRVDVGARAAQQASAQCANVLEVICRMLQLPPGEWAYDRATGQLVMKESSDA